MSNEVRYKLFIDASEDESVLRFLFAFDILKIESTRFICTDRSADHSQKVRVLWSPLLLFTLYTFFRSA